MQWMLQKSVEIDVIEFLYRKISFILNHGEDEEN